MESGLALYNILLINKANMKAAKSIEQNLILGIFEMGLLLIQLLFEGESLIINY